MNRTSIYLLLFFILSTFSVKARTVRTVCNGQWETPIIWSDSSLPGPGDTIIIEHLVRNTDTIHLNNNLLQVDSMAELCSNLPFTLPVGSKIVNYGRLGADQFILDDSLFNYGIMECNFLAVSRYLVNFPDAFLAVGQYTCFLNPDCTPVILGMNNGDLRSNEEGLAYEWQLDGNPLGNATQTIAPMGYGNYTVRVLQADGNFTPWSPPYSLMATSVAPEKENQFAIGSNPGNREFELQIPENVTGDLKIEITDAKGTTFFTQSGLAEDSWRVQTGELPAGLYRIGVQASGSRQYLLWQVVK